MPNLQIKRGTQTAIDSYNAVPVDGEPTWTTDTNKLYVGGVEVGGVGGSADVTTLVTSDSELVAAPYAQGDVRVLTRPQFVPLLAGDVPPVTFGAVEYHDGTYKATKSESTTGVLADWEFISSQTALGTLTITAELLALPYQQGDMRIGQTMNDSGREGGVWMCLVSKTTGDTADANDWAMLSSNNLPIIPTIGYTVVGQLTGELLETPYFKGDIRVLDITNGAVLAGVYVANVNAATNVNSGNILDWTMVSQSDQGVLV